MIAMFKTVLIKRCVRYYLSKSLALSMILISFLQVELNTSFCICLLDSFLRCPNMLAKDSSKFKLDTLIHEGNSHSTYIHSQETPELEFNSLLPQMLSFWDSLLLAIYEAWRGQRSTVQVDFLFYSQLRGTYSKHPVIL